MPTSTYQCTCNATCNMWVSDTCECCKEIVTTCSLCVSDTCECGREMVTTCSSWVSDTCECCREMVTTCNLWVSGTCECCNPLLDLLSLHQYLQVAVFKYIRCQELLYFINTRCKLLCREMVTGKPSPLISSFKLSYYTLLNLMRRLENTNQNMEYVIQHSFQQYQFERTLPDKQVCISQTILTTTSCQDAQ